MTFTEEQMAALAKHERHYYTILNADYASNPGPAALRTIHSILVAAVDWKEPLNSSCNHCWGRLLRTAGDLYFKQLKRNKVVRYFKTSAEAEAYIEKLRTKTGRNAIEDEVLRSVDSKKALVDNQSEMDYIKFVADEYERLNTAKSKGENLTPLQEADLKTYGEELSNIRQEYEDFLKMSQDEKDAIDPMMNSRIEAYDKYVKANEKAYQSDVKKMTSEYKSLAQGAKDETLNENQQQRWNQILDTIKQINQAKQNGVKISETEQGLLNKQHDVQT